MNFSKIFIATITIFFASLSLTTANTSTTGLTELKIGEEVTEGGPRDVVQTMIDVIVLQPETNYLKINIVNSEGEVVIEQETEEIRTTLSTTGLEAGTYRVETEDEGADFQEFVIEVL